MHDDSILPGRRTLLAAALCTAALAGCTETAGSGPPVAAAPGSREALIAALPGLIEPNDIERTRSLAEGVGWTLPPAAETRIGGRWTFRTQKGEWGTVTFNPDKTLTYGSGATGPGDFARFDTLSSDRNARLPRIIVMGEKDDGNWFLPYHRDDDILLVNMANTTQWIELTRG
ncbi:hypothetical protein [Rubrimonas cliftonensis]|uniref:Uncharacterized protein n=1 Tax=Rubrimonas cliftonensis TaxID=89524 RepID=A0A1H4DRK0_9RHOB|nr:hypothetical protein [Rubrimonas cliftonensis]SEA75405.1 hypothetical protein SAMN05444370_1112 [Rubrimonas cliftonensis]